jgi:hypothetical protein
MVQFGPSFAGALNTHARAKYLEARQVWFVAVVPFKWSAASLRVDKLVVLVYAV